MRADYTDRLKESRRVTQIAVQTHGPRVVASVIASTSPEPVDRGNYKRTWYVQDTAEGVTIFNNTPYASVIEAGRRKGSKMPPINLIAEWVRRKGIGTKEEAKGIAFVIARSIARKGTPGKWILKKSQIILDPLVLEALALSVKNRSPVRPQK